MSSPREHSASLALTLALFDIGCIALAFSSAIVLVPADPGLSFPDSVLKYKLYFLVLAGVWCVQALDQRLFVSRRGDALVPQLFALTKTVFTSLVLTIFVVALYHRSYFDREFALVFSAFALLIMVIFRTTMRLGLWGLRRRGYNYRRIVLIGANSRSAQAAEVILSHEHFGYQITGFLDDDSGRGEFLDRFRIPYWGKIAELERYLVEGVIDVVYISLPVRSHYETIQSIAHLCEGVGVPVRLIADLFPLRIATSELMRIGNIPMLDLSVAPEAQPQEALKRLTDVVVSAILLIILAPVGILFAVMVKLDSKGPVFVLERRVNRATDRSFSMIKFRTRELCEGVASPAHGQPSKFGRFLLRYSLDELPELFNVFLGHMSMGDLRPVPAAKPIDTAGAAQ